MLTPLHRYLPGGFWELIPHSLTSPTADGSVAYYLDSLATADPLRSATDDPFDSEVGEAMCRCLTATVLSRSLEVSDGPYIQVLEDDGTVPFGWVMLRAVLWSEEFDLVVPTAPIGLLQGMMP